MSTINISSRLGGAVITVDGKSPVEIDNDVVKVSSSGGYLRISWRNYSKKYKLTGNTFQINSVTISGDLVTAITAFFNDVAASIVTSAEKTTWNAKQEAFNTTITGLRSAPSLSTSLRYYVTDIEKEGFWYVDSSDTTSADNTGTVIVNGSQRVKRVFGSIIEASWFDVVANGTTDDSSNLAKAFAVMSNQKKQLRILGNIKVNTWSALEYSYVNIIGVDRENSMFSGPYTNTANEFIKLANNSVCILKDIGLAGFNLPIQFTNRRVLKLIVKDCLFKTNRKPAIYCDGVSTSGNGGGELVYGEISGNILEDTVGFELRGALSKGVSIINNKFYGITRNQTYYPLPVNGAMELYAINVGDSDDLNPSVIQNITNNIIIHGNIIEEMYNPTATKNFGFNTTNAIGIHGRFADIQHNIIRHCYSNAPTDCEAIYTKITEGIVANNEIYNSGCNDTGSAVINIKAVADVDYTGAAVNVTHSKNIKVYSNICINDPLVQAAGSGVMVFGGQDIEIYDNLFKGQTYAGIYLTGSAYNSPTNNYAIYNNRIEETGINGIYALSTQIYKLDIINNRIKNVKGADAAQLASCINVRALNSGIQHLNIEGNKMLIENLDSTLSLGFKSILVTPLTSASYINITNNNLIILATTFSSAASINGIALVKGSGNYDYVNIDENKFNGAALTTTNFRSITLNNGTVLNTASSFITTLTLGQNYLNGSPILSHKVATATDADYTATDVESLIVLPVITANRALVIPRTGIPYQEIMIRNSNTSAFAWAFPNDGSVRNSLYVTMTTLPNQCNMTLQYDGFAWIVKSIVYTLGNVPLSTKSSAPTTTEIASGQASLYKDTSSGRTGFYFNDAGSIKQLVPTGSATITGDGTTTVFTITHSAGFTPAQVIPSPTNAAAASSFKNGYFISAKGASTFDITFQTAPAAGSNTFDWLIK